MSGTRVLVADDDILTCNILSKALSRGGFVPEIVHRGSDALARLAASDAPRLVLLDWVMPDLSGVDVCRRLRQNTDGTGPYVFLVSGRQGEGDVLQVFEAGVDEFVAKPFDLQVLLARMHAAERRLMAEQARGRRGLWGVLSEASKGATGEVVVRDDQRVGRIFFYQGKVAWIHVAGGLPLLPLLVCLGLDEADARLVLDECRTSGKPFLDTLVDWGLISHDRLYEQMRSELAQRLSSLVELSHNSSFFVPSSTTLQSRFAFKLSELVPSIGCPVTSPRVSGAEPVSSREPPAKLRDLVRDLARLSGVRALSLVDGPSGQVILSEGEDGGESLLHRLIRLLHADSDQPFEEALLVGPSAYHSIHGLPDGWLIYAQVDRKLNPNLGQIRFELSLRSGAQRRSH